MIEHILIIDDSSLARLTLRRPLEKMGVVVHEAESVAEAQQLLSDEPLPQLIFMDITMPNVDGFEGLKAIRQHPQTSHIPVVMYSGDATTENKLRAKQYGAAGFLHKPIEHAQLQALLHKVDEYIQQNPHRPVAKITTEHGETQTPTEHRAADGTILEQNRNYRPTVEECLLEIEQLKKQNRQYYLRLNQLQTILARHSNDFHYLYGSVRTFIRYAQLSFLTAAVALIVILIVEFF